MRERERGERGERGEREQERVRDMSEGRETKQIDRKGENIKETER